MIFRICDRGDIKGRGDEDGRDSYRVSGLCSRKGSGASSDRELGRGAGRGSMDLPLPFLHGISLVLKGVVEHNYVCLKA